MYRRAGIREAPVIDSLRHSLPRILAGSNLQAPERVDCGHCLGAIGDRRPGTGLNEHGVPTPTTCRVPAGTYLIGTTEETAARSPASHGLAVGALDGKCPVEPWHWRASRSHGIR